MLVVAYRCAFPCLLRPGLCKAAAWPAVILTSFASMSLQRGFAVSSHGLEEDTPPKRSKVSPSSPRLRVLAADTVHFFSYYFPLPFLPPSLEPGPCYGS